MPTPLKAVGAERGARYDVAEAVRDELAVFRVIEHDVTVAEIKSLLDAPYD